VGEIILDNTATKGVQINGAWATVPSDSAFGGDSLEDSNSGKGTKSVLFTPTIPATQEYFVYARWTGGTDRATNVPYDVVSSGGRRQTITLDQRNRGGDGWVLLGKFLFDRGTSGSIRVRNDGTNGVVSVDAVRLLPALGAT
jgi:hyaluronate lyase